MKGWPVLVLLWLACPSPAMAAPPFVERGITLPRHDWAFQLGLGVAHQSGTPSFTGAGANFDVGIGLTESLELGIRTGARFGREARLVQADQFGRIPDRQTFGTGTDTWANPEARLRGRMINTSIVELALEGRVVAPIESATRFGAMFGVPLAFHFGSSIRLDAGAYVPVVFHDPLQGSISFPVDLSFQASPQVWLGPLGGLRFSRPGDRSDVTAGFGVGYSVTSFLDWKTMAYFPRLEDTRWFGAGTAIEIRIE